MRLAGRHIGIFLRPAFEDLEFWYPYYRFQEEGARVVPIGSQKSRYAGRWGLSAEASHTVSDVAPDNFHAIIIPGCDSRDCRSWPPDMIEFVKRIHENSRIVAAIRNGPMMLSSAKIIEGRKVTSISSIKEDLIDAGAEWHDQDVIKDNRLITSRQSSDLPAFCRKMISCLDDTVLI